MIHFPITLIFAAAVAVVSTTTSRPCAASDVVDMAKYDKALLYFQFALGCWQIIQLTPVGFLIKALFLWLETFFAKLPTLVTMDSSFVDVDGSLDVVNLSAEGVLVETTLRWHNHSCIFQLEKKKSQASQFTGAGEPTADPTDHDVELQQDVDFDLFLTAKIDWHSPVKYYITDVKFWHRVMAVFRKNCLLPVKSRKVFFGAVDTAEVMSPMDVLDEVLLKHRFVIDGRAWVLPVRNPEEETKLLASMSLAGLYVQVKGYSKLAIGILTLLTTLLQFSDRLRWWVYDRVSATLALPMQYLVDRLAGLRARQKIYNTMATYWERLPPCNDCQARVLRLRSGARFYSLCNVKCNDLRLLGRLPVRSLDAQYAGVDPKESNDFIEGSICTRPDGTVEFFISWGAYFSLLYISSRHVDKSKALLRCFYTFQSGALLSKEGSHVKVLSMGVTPLLLKWDDTVIKLNQWEAVGSVTVK
ncbi:hypothetical protein GOP47_0000447 [Adiantum capillus-veneris]|uniref:Uncharacterized protein n=1 Tax=Adiantum capillus-veneris TaxID=13818 RepID=A0A9D4ZQQ9_ADICA|nr:hypothetical protein GOP47_0000447 [Adiantum capillus-veneris]